MRSASLSACLATDVKSCGRADLEWRLVGSGRRPGTREATLGVAGDEGRWAGLGSDPLGLELGLKQEAGFPGSPDGCTSHVVSLGEPEGTLGGGEVGSTQTPHS